MTSNQSVFAGCTPALMTALQNLIKSDQAQVPASTMIVSLRLTPNQSVPLHRLEFRWSSPYVEYYK